MTQPTLRELLRHLLSDDESLYAQLCESGLVPLEDAELAPEHLETARVVRTLVRELEVNWAGVEVILRMRTELIAARRQVSDLAALLRERQNDERGS